MINCRGVFKLSEQTNPADEVTFVTMVAAVFWVTAEVIAVGHFLFLVPLFMKDTWETEFWLLLPPFSAHCWSVGLTSVGVRSDFR